MFINGYYVPRSALLSLAAIYVVVVGGTLAGLQLIPGFPAIPEIRSYSLGLLADWWYYSVFGLLLTPIATLFRVPLWVAIVSALLFGVWAMFVVVAIALFVHFGWPYTLGVFGGAAVAFVLGYGGAYLWAKYYGLR